MVSTGRARAPLFGMKLSATKKFLIGCVLVLFVAVCAALLM
jgi:hypothetical protein